MGRPSRRVERRLEIVEAFARVLAERGSSGATVAAIAEEAGIAAGLVHHHFSSKQDLYEELLATLVQRFRRRADRASGDFVARYADAAVALGADADVTAARAWVGLFAEGMADPRLFQKLRRMLDAEVAHIAHRSGGKLSESDASAVLAFIVGALVFGAFAPRKTAGFAAPALRRMLASFT